jgi:dTDP-4-amino-4,6-dideoxygalactose transaminase
MTSELQKYDIEVRPLIAGNMANKPMWKGKKDNLPNCESIDKCGFYLPNHQDLTTKEINLITNILNFENEKSFNNRD